MLLLFLKRADAGSSRYARLQHRLSSTHSSYFILYLYVREGYNAFNDFNFLKKEGAGDMGDKGGKKDKAKDAKQAKIKKDAKQKK